MIKFQDRERSGRDVITKITGPWKAAIRYVLGTAAGRQTDEHYDAVFRAQFFDLNQELMNLGYFNLPLLPSK